MKFSVAAMAALLVADSAVEAFAPIHLHGGYTSQSRTTTTSLFDMPLPPASSNLPVVQPNTYGQPSDIRYSDFLKLVNADRIEKVTFSSDGTQLLGVDADGVRVKIEALPNDPDLLTQLTSHKVRHLTRDSFFPVEIQLFCAFYSLSSSSLFYRWM
jgi:hypothetical protein